MSDETALDDTAPEPAEPDGMADFDAFWAEEHVRPEADGMPFRMFGSEWRLPSRLPALFQLQMHRVQSSRDPEDMQALLAALLPDALITEMIRRRVDDRHLSVLLAWATANTNRAGSLSLDRAAELIDQREAGKGKARKPKKKRKPATSSGRS